MPPCMAAFGLRLRGRAHRRPRCCNLVSPESTMSLLNHPFDPEHDAALVTGAGNGIGRAIAQALVAKAFARCSPTCAKTGVPRRWPPRLGPTGRGVGRRPVPAGGLRRASGASTRDTRACDALRPQRFAAASRGGSRPGREHRDLAADASGQCRRRLPSRPRTGARPDLGGRARFVPDADVAARRYAAQPAALQFARRRRWQCS